MRNFYMMTVGFMATLAGLLSTAQADDVVVRHTTRTGKSEKLVVDHRQLPELTKALSESRTIETFRSAEKHERESAQKIPMRSPAADDEQQDGFKVFFAVEDEQAPEGMIYMPWKVYVCKGNGAYGREYYNYSYYPDDETLAQGYAWGCYVPEGEYTIILCSNICLDTGAEYPEYLTCLYIVKENVRIEGDTTITFRQSEAKNIITASLVLPDGTVAPGDSYVYDDDGNLIGEREDLWIGSSRSFINVNGDYSLNLGNFEGSLDMVYINDISDNWIYAINMAMVDANGAYASCVTRRGPITSSLEIRNDPADYRLTSVRFNQNLPNVNPDVKGFGISTQIAWKGADWNLSTGGMTFDKYGICDEIPVYIDAPASDLTSPDAIDLITSIAVATDKIKITPEDWEGNPVLDENGDPYFYYSYLFVKSPGIYQQAEGKYICMDNFGYDISEYPEESFLLPYDKLFSYEKTAETEFFTNAPVLSMVPDSFIREGYSRFGVYPTSYYPCLSSYDLTYTLSASFNGEIIVENKNFTLFDWDEWANENYKEGGLFDVKINALWNADDAESVVESRISIDTRKEDYSAPQVIRWQLRDSDNITDKATSESRLIVMCQEDMDSDFDFNISIAQLPDHALEANKIREEPFYDMGIWQTRRVYEVNLSDFPGVEGEKYSLVFQLSDASDNTSVQTIGNAFEWAESTGITSAANDYRVFVTDGKLHAPEDATVFTVDGQRADRTSLNRGLYIVKTKTGAVKIMIP